MASESDFAAGAVTGPHHSLVHVFSLSYPMIMVHSYGFHSHLLPRVRKKSVSVTSSVRLWKSIDTCSTLEQKAGSNITSSPGGPPSLKQSNRLR
ncbi:hypothetical protein BDR04DRAFT_28927 [Suillus decipiens]|nr:hypothetical protein BDR04DRAFT_28927 [Suillus decipiens]